MRRFPAVLSQLSLAITLPVVGYAQAPELEAWQLNTSGETGFNGLPANIQRIRYAASNVYVNASGVPHYSIGPWPMNPNTVTNQAELLRIPRLPVSSPGAKTATGLGSIGVEVAKRALSFGMHVRGIRRRVDAPAPLSGVELVDSPAAAVAGARHIVIATPLTPATRHLVDRELLGHLTPGAHIVNIARGGIIDQDALRVALDDGTVACASLDTVDPEPLPMGHWLYAHPRVRLSPHVSWSVPTSMDLLYEMFAANLTRYVAGEPLEGIVDRAERY